MSTYQRLPLGQSPLFFVGFSHQGPESWTLLLLNFRNVSLAEVLFSAQKQPGLFFLRCPPADWHSGYVTRPESLFSSVSSFATGIRRPL